MTHWELITIVKQLFQIMVKMIRNLTLIVTVIEPLQIFKMVFIQFLFSWWFLSYSILHAFSFRNIASHCRLFCLCSDRLDDVDNNVDHIAVGGRETNDFIVQQVNIVPHSNANGIRLQAKKIISTSLGISLLGTSFLQYKSESEYAIVKDTKRSMFSKYMNDSNLNVLEIGFGDDRNVGANFDYYPINRNTTLVGIDPLLATVDESSRNGIIRRYQDKGVHLQLNNMSCDDLLFASSSFDVVVSTLVFCSIKEGVSDRAVDEIVRVLKPNGVFISLG